MEVPLPKKGKNIGNRVSFRKSAKNQKGERLGFKGGRSCDQYYQIDYIALKNLRLYDFSQKDLNYNQCTYTLQKEKGKM